MFLWYIIIGDDMDNFSQKLSDESKHREEMLDDAIKLVTSMSDKKMNDEKTLQQYKVDEIKYKTTINELNEYVDIYKNKTETLEKQNKEFSSELINLRKKDLESAREITALKTVLDVLIKECGIERISEITKIDENKLEEYIR